MRIRPFLIATLNLGLALPTPRSSAALGHSSEPQSQKQSEGDRERGERLLGTVESVGVDRFAIKTGDGTTQTVLVDDQTHYRQGQQEIQLEDLKAGDRVFVRAETNSNKATVALMVRRVSDEEMARFQNAANRVIGEITAIDKNQLKVRNPVQGEKTVTVNEQTVFMKEGQAIALKDLKVGDRIFALGKEADGQFVAARIMTGRFQGRRGEGGGVRERPEESKDH